MALPFLVGVFASIKKNARGSVKEALKRQNGDLEKLSIKEDDCAAALKALRDEELRCTGSIGGLVERIDRITLNKPKFDELTISSVKLIPYDKKALKAAADAPEEFIAQSFPADEDWRIKGADQLPSPEDAPVAWDAMEKNEKILNGYFAYYDALTIIAERYENSLGMLRGVMEKHISVLDAFYERNRKIDWQEFGDTEKMAYQNSVLLAKLIYEMCSVPLIKKDAEAEGTGRINTDECIAMLDKAARFCGERGFEYDGKSYDVVLRGSARNYFNYCYRLEERLPLLLPISREQAAPILEKLRMDSDVVISRDVTHMHARILMDKLRDVDIKSQRVISPDGTSVYYIELV